MKAAGKYILNALEAYTKYSTKPIKNSIFANKSQKLIGNNKFALNRKKYPQRISMTAMHKY